MLTLLRFLMPPGVEFIGEICESQKSEFLGGAQALLFPISWPEPFGLVMIEAMACGTPVIAFNRGAVSEIVRNGVTGFVVENVDQAVRAVARVAELDRRTIRAIFERYFSVEVMAANYETAYATVLAGRRGPRSRRDRSTGEDNPLLAPAEVPIAASVAAPASVASTA